MRGNELNLGPSVIPPLQGEGNLFAGCSRAFSPGCNRTGFQPPIGTIFLCLLLCSVSAAVAEGQVARQPDFRLSGDIARPIAAIAFSPDSRFLAVAGSDHAILLYDVRADRNLRDVLSRKLTGHEAPIVALVFKDSNTLVSVSLDQTAKIWNVASGKVLHSAELNMGNQVVPALAPDNQALFAGASSNRVRLWNYESGELLKTFDANDSAVSTLAFTPDGKLLVIGTIKGVIRVMDVATWKVARIIDMDSPVHSLAASSDRIAVGYADGTLNLLSLGEQTSIPEIKAHERAVSALAFSPSGQRFASGSANGVVKVWDSDSLKPLYTLAGRTARVLSVAFSSEGKHVAAVNVDGEVDCWTIR